MNKAPGIINPNEWDRINRKNGYPLPDDSNVAADGTRMRSKSELIIHGMIRSYGLVMKYDHEIMLKNDIGQKVAVSPDYLIRCNDGSWIIIVPRAKAV